MQDISAVGTSVFIQCIPTYPAGFTITELAGNVNPLDSAVTQIADKEMGVNGDLVVWSTANSIDVTIRPIVNSEADKNLQILFDVNRVAKNKVSAQDIVTMVINYPDGTIRTLVNGKLLSGNAVASVESSGRLGTREYQFAFENKLN